MMQNDDDNVDLQDFLNYKAYTVPGENDKDLPIDFSNCGIYYVDETKCKKIKLDVVNVLESNVIIDGEEILTDKDSCIKVIGPKIKILTKYTLDKNFYSSGTSIFEIQNHKLNPNDDVIISYTTNKAWLQKLNMTSYWKSGITMQWFAKVKSINSNIVTLDSPITYSLNKKYGSFFLASYKNNRIKNIIIKNITIRTTSRKEQTSGIYLENCENVLIENVKIYGYDRGVKISDGSNHVTVKNCIVYEANTPVEGGNRYAYEIDGGNNCLVENCVAYKSRHPYAGGGRCCGPHVFYNCKAIQNMKNATSQPHRLWGNGFLYDNIEESNGIDFENREDSGSGHGWAAANCIAWNCKSKIVCENPPTARNFAIGCVGGRNTFYKGNVGRPMHTMISEGNRVIPESLFLYQKEKK
jgi:hypothetical protein